MHLQFSVHSKPSWKHSQYFFIQKDLRQEQPFTILTPSPLKAFVIPLPLQPLGILFMVLSFWLRQSVHRHCLVHSVPAAKHSQYSFMHLELRQLQYFSQAGFQGFQSEVIYFIFKFKLDFRANHHSLLIFTYPSLSLAKISITLSIFYKITKIEMKKKETISQIVFKQLQIQLITIHILLKMLLTVIKLSIQQTDLMGSLSSPLQTSSMQLLQRIIKDTTITPLIPLQQPHTPFYTIIESFPSLTVVDFRNSLRKVNKNSSTQCKIVAQKIIKVTNEMIRVLEHNQECRFGWVEGVGGRLDRGTKVDLFRLQQERVALLNLIKDSNQKVGSKSELQDFIVSRQRQLFEWKDDPSILTTFKHLLIPNFPQSYQQAETLSDSVYPTVYEVILQNIHIYRSQSQKYLKKELPLDEFQIFCGQIGNQNSILVRRNKINAIIKYVLHFCGNRYKNMLRNRKMVWQMRSSLIKQTLRCYYLAFHAKIQIHNINLALDMIQQSAIKRINSPYKSANQGVNLKQPHFSLNFSSIVSKHISDSVSEGPLNKEITNEKREVQNKFSQVLNYLTQHKQIMYTKFFQRKLKKRCKQLFNVQQRITNIQKLFFKPSCVEEVMKSIKIKNEYSLDTWDRKVQQLIQMKKQFTPINDYQFRILYQQIQNLKLFAQTAKQQQWLQLMHIFQQQLLKQQLFDHRGQRRISRVNISFRMSESRMSNGLNKSRISNKQFFEENYQYIIEQRLSHSQLHQNQPQQEIDNKQICKEGMIYLSSINTHMAEQLRDQSNFKVYLLPKLINKVQIALKMTPYTQQHLHLELTRLLQNIKFIPFIIKPELNQQKIDIILYPSINNQLFSSFRRKMMQHFAQLKQLESQIEQDPLKKQTIQENVQYFMKKRLDYLYLLLQHIDRLDVISYRVSKALQLEQEYSLASEGTYNVVLTLLLAQKEVKALKQSLEDSISHHSHPKKHIQLLIKQICPLFLRSLPYRFQYQNNITAPNTLELLLELSQGTWQSVAKSNQIMDSTIKQLEYHLKNMKSANITQRITKQIFQPLQILKDKLMCALTQAIKFAGLNINEVNRQVVKIDQFVRVSQNKGKKQINLSEDGSKRFFSLLRALKI